MLIKKLFKSKMKSIFCGLIILNIISIIYTSIYKKVYSEDPENMKRRLKYLQSYSNEITDGQIEFVYTEQNGIYCNAKRDIAPYEVLFDIPAKYVVSYCKQFYL